MRPRLLLFTIFALFEIAVIIEVGRAFGTAQILFEIIISAFIGWLVITSTTNRTGIRVRQALATLEVPAQSLVKGIMAVFGGILLLIPGLVTDLIGLILAIPLTQVLVIKHFRALHPKLFKH
jgi:UPF0716 protein FxsA